MSDSEAIQQVRAAEAARNRALLEGDVQGLSALVSDELVHIHATGQVDDKAGYLRLVESGIRFLQVERKDLKVQVNGDVAVATGRLAQRIEFRASGERRDMDVVTTQVWLRRDNVWRQISFQATNV
ncbi:MAG: nuclear transport factor 2 family protein [Pseudomonas sp.]